MSSLKDTLSKIAEALESEKIKFALIGGFALAAHGVFRATIDIDLLVDGAKKDVARKTVTSAGFQIVFESAEVLQLSGPGQVDFLFANRELTQKMLETAKIDQNANVPVVSVEDLIGLKIQAYKNDPSREYQDKADIQELIKANPKLDLKNVKNYADLFNEWATIESIRKRI